MYVSVCVFRKRKNFLERKQEERRKGRKKKVGKEKVSTKVINDTRSVVNRSLLVSSSRERNATNRR